MEIRFKLISEFDADLIARIKEKSNGSGNNLAARFLMRHWFENEKIQSLPQERRQSDVVVSTVGQDDQDLEDQLTDALADLDSAW